MGSKRKKIKIDLNVHERKRRRDAYQGKFIVIVPTLGKFVACSRLSVVGDGEKGEREKKMRED